MTTPHASKTAQIRARLNHPIIDSDGHTVENANVLAEYIKSEAGSRTAERFIAAGGVHGSVASANLAEARDRRITRGPWWGMPAANTLDRQPLCCRSCCTNGWMNSGWIIQCSTPRSAFG
jgi:hypothetical protein